MDRATNDSSALQGVNTLEHFIERLQAVYRPQNLGTKKPPVKGARTGNKKSPFSGAGGAIRP